MSNEFVKVPADLWSAIQNDLLPIARRVMESRGGFDAFPEAYAVMNQVRDFTEFSSSEMDAQIFGFKDEEVKQSSMEEAVSENGKEPAFVANLNPMVRGYYDNLPENVRNEFNQAVETRMEELGEVETAIAPFAEMAEVLNDAVSTMSEEIKVEETGLIIKASDPESWKAWLKCFFEAARDLRNEFEDSGLLNSMAACDKLIAQQKKTLPLKDREYVDSLFNVHELNLPN